MKLELRKATDGARFVICIISERTSKQLVIPLSPTLSSEIERMVRADGVKTDRFILPPNVAPTH